VTRWVPALALAGCVAGSSPPPLATQLVVLNESAPVTVDRFELATADRASLIELDRFAFAYSLAVGPDQQLVMSTSPAPQADEPAAAFSVLTRLDDGVFAHVFGDALADSWCFFPEWAPTGDTVWFVQSDASMEPGESALTALSLGTGEAERFAGWATEPAVSSDGKVVYVAIDPDTADRRLHVLDPVSGQDFQVWGPDLRDMGLPMFSPDGEFLYFLRLSLDPLDWMDALAWLNPLVSTAVAHNGHDRPADWWRIPVTGGEPEQVTFLGTIHYAGVVDPGGNWLFVATREGVQQVDLRSGEATVILADRSIRDVDVWDAQ
jgi:hypothetical protein